MSDSAERDLKSLFREAFADHGDRVEEVLALIILAIEPSPPEASMRGELVRRVLARCTPSSSRTPRERLLAHLSKHPLPESLERDLSRRLRAWMSDTGRPTGQCIERLLGAKPARPTRASQAAAGRSVLAIRIDAGTR
jgi:hypothetical protein